MDVIQPNATELNAGRSGHAAHAAQSVVLDNSRMGCMGMYLITIASLLIGVCMILAALPLVFPLSHLTFMRVLAAAQWSLGGFMMIMMCPGIWKWTAGMAHRKVTLDERGAEFVLGTSKQPVELSMPWDQVGTVEEKRDGNVQRFTINGKDGSYAQFSSYSFFRPRRVARMIAERAGLTVQRT